MNPTLVHIAPSRSGHFFVQHVLKSWLSTTVYNAENLRPRQLRWAPFRSNTIIVIQTRDLLNWYASVARSILAARVDPSVFRFVLKDKAMIWMAITRAFYDLHPHRQYLGEYPVVKIMYDQFVNSKEYRRRVCDQLGGNYNERMLNHVPREGQGSSFDGMEYARRGTRMDTLTRYTQLPTKLYQYWNVLEECGAVGLYREHMKPNEPKLKFLQTLII